MNIVLIIPTGIGAEIGGHAGDANPVARLIASVCDNLIIHPNVVNASDINEMPENAWYVEGSMLDRFLKGEIKLKKGYLNKILLAVNPPLDNKYISASSAARATLGAQIEIIVLNHPLKMIAKMEDGIASGEIYNWRELIDQISHYSFDALAIATPIDVSAEVALNYFKNGGVNPWGGVEAKASRLIAMEINKPVAHAPVVHVEEIESYNEIVDPRMAAETVSLCYVHCVLKGLHKAPRINANGFSVEDIDCLISPYGCIGTPHIACMSRGIPVIVVKENRTVLNNPIPDDFIIVENYLEAAGLVVSMKSGIHWRAVRRPLGPTKILNDQ